MQSRDKFLLLVSTAFPGVAKIVILYFLTLTLGIDNTGYLAYKWGVVMFMSIICVDGFSMLLNSRLPLLESVILKQAQVISLYISGALLMLVLGGGWAVIDDRFVCQDWVLIFSLFSYGFVRRTLIVVRSYSAIIAIDTISLVTAITILITFKPTVSNLVLIFIGYFVVSAVFVLKTILLESIKYIELSFYLKGVVFGLNNALSGGIPLLILPIIASRYGDTVVGYVSMIVSVVSIGLLVPRSISLYYLPILGKERYGEGLTPIYRSFDAQVSKFLIIFLLLSPLLWVGFAPFYLFVDLFDMNVAPVFFIIVLYLVLSQLALTPSCMFSVFEMPSVVFKSNIIYFLVSISAVYLTIMLVKSGVAGVLSIYGAFCLFQLIRAVYLRTKVVEVCL